ncbi:hypothetical protein BKA66DRAFT_444437 [Pyrenochaeta sp. MPI-SDFR-AT-0127]|nr:hypothetical protein BKA66DRAFT_444437 [Pyrenochaeta sp. MPI-SDFR-AT-0127]
MGSNSPNPPSVTNHQTDSTPLPAYLARHVKLGFDSEDVSALLDSIDSSQNPHPSSTHLPAELLLQILEHVPVDYVLDWRLICRGFRDAIDGRVLFYHLHRTQLIGYMGSRHSRPLERLDDEQYDRIHLLRAHFTDIEKDIKDTPSAERPRPVWNGTHAFFEIEDDWFQSFRYIGGAATRGGDTIEDADVQWLDTLDRLELRRKEEGFGTLRWCLKLDHAVLDMDFPLEAGRNTFDVDIHLHKGTIRVAWKDMLFSFLKTERALRRTVEEKQNSKFTFSHVEDCLRAVRRQRLQSTLDPDDRVDRHIKWSLRLLHPLFGKHRYDHRITLEDVENDATGLLLLLRREAALTHRQLAYLHQLASDYEAMDSEMHALDQAFREFKSHLAMPGFQLSVSLPGLNPRRLSRNPISWPDDLRTKVEEQVGKWKAQRQVIDQMKCLLAASNMALSISAEDLSSQI